MPPSPRKSPVVDLDKPRGGSDLTRRPTSKAECNSLVAEKNGSFKLSDHLSSLLFSDDVLATVIEASTIIALFVLSYWRGSAAVLDVAGSASFKQITWVFVGKSLLVRCYNAYLEGCYFAFPQYRTQPVKEHALKKEGDLCGRDREQLELLVWHDRMTYITQTLFYYALYYAIPGFYPEAKAWGAYEPLPIRVLKLVGHHLVLSFSMYWLHRALHVHPALWKHIHSVHHWATHPLSRVTYQDHWLDNLGNEMVGALLAQILVPLDFQFFILTRCIRVMESLEKHSGISCWLNLAHTAQAWFPYAQAPHHHDWHHKGFKSCNYTFAPIGGIWDYIFGTRKAGRGRKTLSATREDLAMEETDTRTAAKFDEPLAVLMPLLVVPALIAVKHVYF